MRGDGVEHGLRFGVREVEVGGLGDFSFGVGDDDPGLLFDGRVPLGVVSGHGGAVAEQPEQRVGDGRLAGAVAADEPAHHRQVVAEPPGRDDDHVLAVAGDMGPSGRRASAQKITDK